MFIYFMLKLAYSNLGDNEFELNSFDFETQPNMLSIEVIRLTC